MTWNLSSAMHLTNCSRVVAVVEVLPHCLQENPKQMVVKLEQKWKPKDNVCLLFALWGMMSFDANPFLKWSPLTKPNASCTKCMNWYLPPKVTNIICSYDIMPQSADSKHTLSLGFHFCSNFATICFSKRTFTLSFTMHFLSFFLTPTLATVTIGLVMLLSILRREVMYDYDSATSA